MGTLGKVLLGAIPVLVPLVAAALLMPLDFPILRREHSFLDASLISAAMFAIQHLYRIASVGLVPGLASVMLAALLAFPLALMFEHGGNAIGAPAISNAPCRGDRIGDPAAHGHRAPAAASSRAYRASPPNRSYLGEPPATEIQCEGGAGR